MRQSIEKRQDERRRKEGKQHFRKELKSGQRQKPKAKRTAKRQKENKSKPVQVQGQVRVSRTHTHDMARDIQRYKDTDTMFEMRSCVRCDADADAQAAPDKAPRRTTTTTMPKASLHLLSLLAKSTVSLEQLTTATTKRNNSHKLLHLFCCSAASFSTQAACRLFIAPDNASDSHSYR